MRTTEQIRRDMADSMPSYYSDSLVVGNVLDREAAEFGAVNAALYDVLDQFFIDTATWGLANWERMCGVPTDLAKPIEQRRSVVKAKIRGIGTVTVALIKSVAESFENGAVEVTDGGAAYTIGIRFVATTGVPENLADIQAALRDIIPAHLAIDYSFKYLRVNEVHGVMTINTIQATKLNKFSPFTEVL